MRGRRVTDGLLFRGFVFREGACLAGIQKLLRIHTTEQLDQFCDYAGPSGLVAGSQARAVIAVEVLVEQYVVFPQRIGLEFLRASEHRC